MHIDLGRSRAAKHPVAQSVVTRRLGDMRRHATKVATRAQQVLEVPAAQVVEPEHHLDEEDQAEHVLRNIPERPVADVRGIRAEVLKSVI